MGATAPVPTESGVVGSGVEYSDALCFTSLCHFESSSVCLFRCLFWAPQVRNVWEHLKNQSLNSCSFATICQICVSFSLLHPIYYHSFFIFGLCFFTFSSSMSYSLLCNCYRELSTLLIWCIKYFILNYAVLFLSYSVYFSFILQDEKCRFIKHFLWLFEGRPTPLVDFCFS